MSRGVTGSVLRWCLAGGACCFATVSRSRHRGCAGAGVRAGGGGERVCPSSAGAPWTGSGRGDLLWWATRSPCTTHRRAGAEGRAGWVRVIGPPTGVRVYLAAGVTDMRKGFDGLAALVQQRLGVTARK